MGNYRVTYDSIEDLAKAAVPLLHHRRENALDPDWAGVGSVAELESLAIDGWADEFADAMDIAESAVDLVQQDHDMPAFRPLWDVAGCEVDVARYLSGEPENMIDYEMVQTSRAGRVIVLCASVSISAAVSAAKVKQRGHGIAALAFALTRMGLNVELWADMSSESYNGTTDSIRVLVKGANDELDPARIMFAYAHPAMLRSLCLSAMHAWPAARQEANGVGMGYAGKRIGQPVKDLPDGTIYLPPLISDRDVSDPTAGLIVHLSKLGLL